MLHHPYKSNRSYEKTHILLPKYKRKDILASLLNSKKHMVIITEAHPHLTLKWFAPPQSTLSI